MIKLNFNFVLLFIFIILPLSFLNMNALYITDENYEQILMQSQTILKPIVKINDLDVTVEKDLEGHNLDYSKSIPLADNFNIYMGQFFTALKNLIGQCENKKDSWIFFRSRQVMYRFIGNLQLYYYQRNETITLNFIKMFNEAFDSIEDKVERRNTKILACYAIYSSEAVYRLMACYQLRIYWDEKTEQAFLHIIPETCFLIDIFKHFSGKSITEEDRTFTSESKKLKGRNAFGDQFLYTISFQNTTSSHFFLPICQDFFQKSLKEIRENKEKFSPKSQPSIQQHSTAVTENKFTAQLTSKKDMPAEQNDQSNPTQVGFGTRFLQKLKTYAVPIFFGTAALSAVYFFRAYLM